MKSRIARILLNAAALLTLAGVAYASLPAVAGATHMPADKVGVAASTVEEVSPSEKTILSATFRNSNPTDLMIQVTSECALWTNIASPEGSAAATVTVWVELDGMPVPVTNDPAQGGPDDGRVVFCNRDFRILAPLSPPELIQLFLKSKSANAFNWVALNVGSGIHQLAVKARLEQSTGGLGFAQSAVGRRTLIVEPAKLAKRRDVLAPASAAAPTRRASTAAEARAGA